ncbi:epidermal growth factor receptor kinase substrate 8-like protein 1 isoform X2 [Pyxicephalus adspersus]|uniref:epidermal growth factor receptor kinase substrate 8-like protein 1 isoform X2 n=1 Tax=Pyxicephalus adspersus TaxID=30357 RepID=UPI003B5CBCB9
MSGSPRLNGISKPNAKSIYEQRKKYSNVIMADVSEYQVNHLVTFTIDEDDDVHTVEDAIRKLNAMDSKSRLWIQEMVLQVNSSTVKLLDIESKEDLEVFPISSIQRCDTVLPERRNRSLLVLVCQDRYQPKADVHFFQCDDVGAELISEDINSAVSDLKSGQTSKRPEALRNNQKKINEQSPSSSGPFQPQRQWKQPQIHYVTPLEILERESQRRSVKPSVSPLNPQVIINPVPQMQQQQHQKQSSDSSQDAIYSQVIRTEKNSQSPLQERNTVPETVVDGDTQDLTALRAGRDVDLLNHCFDDIELFMGKLQKSAEAFKVLNQRKKSRRSKKPEAGEGLLTLRARPPKLDEYEDAVQKFKYCFCLLARLKNNIMNPSSVELVHFLFGPLRTLVDSSGGVDMAAGIRSPMLTKEAVGFLNEFLDENELELWNSLGPNWTKPRMDFPRDYCTLYTPTFYSGWVPSNINGQPWDDPVELQHRHEELRSQVLDDSKKWWKVQNRFGQIGYVPYNILSPVSAAEFNNAKQNGIQPSSPTKKSQPPTPPKKPTKPNMISQAQWNTVDSRQPEQNHVQQDKFDKINSMNEELLLRLANGRTGPNKTLSIQRMLDTSIPLNEESTPSEVTAWLQAKGFNTLTVKSLGVLNGAQLFSLQKDEFKAVSSEEGARVYSQVMVQKALLEDDKKISELEAVMERQKKKVDSELQ